MEPDEASTRLPAGPSQSARRGPGPSRTGDSGEGAAAVPSDPEGEASAEPESGAQAEALLREVPTGTKSQLEISESLKAIYKGLFEVEAKCIRAAREHSRADGEHGTDEPRSLTDDQWQGLVKLHCGLLDNFYDFFLASQTPLASDAVKRLPLKYGMPARLRRNGIYPFLDLLRRKHPDSHDHFVTFCHMAYSTMVHLYQTVPAFDALWSETIGHIAQYRMALESEDQQERAVWRAVSRSWYTKGSDKLPSSGHLYHCLSTLATPNPVVRMFYYTKALCTPIPYPANRDSIHHLFGPLTARGGAGQDQAPSCADAFARIHVSLCLPGNYGVRAPATGEFLGALDADIALSAGDWRETGYQMAIINCNALLGYGAEDHHIVKAARQPIRDGPGVMAALYDKQVQSVKLDEALEDAVSLFAKTGEIVYRRLGDANVYPYLHASLVALHFLSAFPAAMEELLFPYPWEQLDRMLDSIEVLSLPKFLAIGGGMAVDGTDMKIDGDEFPRDDWSRPLPEDYALRGLLWTEPWYFPDDWFKAAAAGADEDERHLERPSTTEARKLRILWLARKLVKTRRTPLTYGESRTQGGLGFATQGLGQPGPS